MACGTLPSADESTGTDTDAPSTTTTTADSDSGTDTSTTAPVEPDVWDDLLEPLPGSRLRPIFRVAEDGTQAHIGWHDTMFDAPCDFRPQSDGVLRCVPTRRGDDPWHYADASCTEPALQQNDALAGALTVSVRGDGCFDQTYYELGEEITEIYFNANGPCEFFSNDPSWRVYALPPAQFVAATVTPQDGNSRIVPLLLEADDGARQIVGAWDVVHEEEVAPGPDAAEQLRWFGRFWSRVSTSYYADPACTEPAALAECVPTGARPRTAIESEPGYCSPVTGRRELLEEVAQVYVLDSGGDCEVADIYYSRAWRVGGALDEDAFAVAPLVAEGGARLRHDVYSSPEGEPFLSSLRFFDHLLAEVECRWRDTYPPTGALDCVPLDSATPSYTYADAACTQQTASRYVFEESCPVPGEALYAYAAGIVSQLVGPTAGPGDYILDEQEDCVPVEPDGDSGDGGDGEEQYYLIDDASEIEAAHAADVVQ